ncbi:homeodomain-only protein [Equus quagga]|uniref:homeodomain-only protein n=1 Tax=Equus quagga TaxID=89248 RepID=UPI001EE286D8|nr:homeodomain-only protein [Equus quagga]
MLVLKEGNTRDLEAAAERRVRVRRPRRGLGVPRTRSVEPVPRAAPARGREALKVVFRNHPAHHSVLRALGPRGCGVIFLPPAQTRTPGESRAGTMSAETASGPTEDQVEILEYNFNKVNKHPDPTTLCLIAAEAGLSEEETQVSPVIPRSEMWHLESNPQREDFAKGSLLPLALDDFSLLPPHITKVYKTADLASCVRHFSV